MPAALAAIKQLNQTDLAVRICIVAKYFQDCR